MILFIFTLILIATLGYLAQTTGLCLVRGVSEAVSGKPLFLFAILCSGAFAWAPVLIAHLMKQPIPFISYDVTFLAIIGGLLFGFGAAINNGCGVSTISKLARGQVVMLATIAGWLIGWVLFASFIPSLQPAHFKIAPEWHYGGLFIFSILTVIFVRLIYKSDKKIWASMLAIGLMASIAFFCEPKWTPSSLLKDVSLSLWQADRNQCPSFERFVLMAALICGMVVAALQTHSFRSAISGWRVIPRHLFAGILMGVGAVFAGGGNDTQLLLALPALSAAGVTTVLSMLVGIYLGRKVS